MAHVLWVAVEVIVSNVRAMGPSPTSENPSLGWFHLGGLLVGSAVVGPASIWATNAGRNVDVPMVIGAGLLVLVAGVIVATLARGRKTGHLVAAQAATLVFWSWQVVPVTWFPSPAGDTVAGLLAVAIGAWIASRLSVFEWLPAVFGVGFGVASLSMIVTGFVGDWSNTVLPDPSLPIELVGASADADVVVLVLDAHAGPSILTEFFNYDMGPTVVGLEQAGFSVVDPTFSNYTMTYYSVSSLLSLDYLADAGGEESPALSRLVRRVVAGDAGIMSWMSDAGYYVTKLESGWEEDRCGDVSRCIRQPSFGGVTGWLLIGRTPFRSFRTSHPYPTTALEVLESLPGLVVEAAANDRPDFIMAHVLSPHAPLFLTAACHNRYVEGLGGVNVGSPLMSPAVAKARADAYAGQVQCVGLHLRRLADAVVGTDTVVLLVGDHGSDIDGQTYFPLQQWTERQLLERFSVFAAVKAPSSCGQTPDTVVNLSRYVFGCALNVDLPDLPDRFLGSAGHASPIVDVTSRVSALPRWRQSVNSR